ncbi:MAG: flippase-like domain-containing protein [Ardenticatenaceae bacterium]|nr:flippase-like domain-containing protein [Ardenticatenaceae bacterium]
MIAENKQERPSSRSTSRKLFSWLNVLLGIILVGWGLWYIAREITFSEIAKAMSVANIPLILLAFLVVLFTQAIKAWRWQLLFFPKESNLTFSAAFWAVMLGQFVNTAVSFLRLGELARIYALYQQTKISKIRSLGTLVLEKTLELITLVVTLAVLIPFVVVPDFMTERGITVGIAAAIAFCALYLLAYQTQFVIRILRRLLQILPPTLSERLLRWAVSGLEGLAALRSKRVLVEVVGISLLIGLVSVVTPWILFPALGLPYGIIDAVLIHIVTTLASAIPVPTPAKLGVFEAAVVFMLNQFGLDNSALAFSYAILFHVIIILPQILFGAVAASRTNWRWRATTLPPETTLQQSPHSL